jgi:hypothetical protein
LSVGSIMSIQIAPGGTGSAGSSVLRATIAVSADRSARPFETQWTTITYEALCTASMNAGQKYTNNPDLIPRKRPPFSRARLRGFYEGDCGA